VGPFGVVVDPPLLRQYLHFFQGVEDLSVRKFVPQFRVEAFAVAVLPWSPELDIERGCTDTYQPFRNSVATNSGPLSKRIYPRMPCSIMASASTSITLALLILRRTWIARHSRVYSSIKLSLRCRSIVSGRADEVIRPGVIPMFWPQSYARTVVEPQAAARLLLLRNLRPFAAPDSLHTVFAHVPAGSVELDRDAPISVRADQRNDSPGQCVFVVPLCGLVALRAAWLMNQLAHMSVTRSALLSMRHSGTPALRA
jgi:hypothetical protein